MQRFYRIILPLLMLLHGTVTSMELSDAKMELSDAKLAHIDASVDHALTKIDAAERQIDAALVAVDKMPPEAFMTPMERFHKKKIVSVSKKITSQTINVTQDSTDEQIELGHGWFGHETKKKNVPLNLTFSVEGRDVVYTTFLGAAYGVDYAMFKNMQRIDEDILFRKVMHHKQALFDMIKKFRYSGKRKWFFSKVPRELNPVQKLLSGDLMGALHHQSDVKYPDEDEACDKFCSFIKKECIAPALGSFKDRLPTECAYMAALEGLSALHDKAQPQENGWKSQFADVQNRLDTIHSTTAFYTRNAYMIRDCFNWKTNNVKLSLRDVMAPFFGMSYNFYFKNSYAANKNSLSKWILKFAFPQASLDWLNSYWFYGLKKAIIHARFIQQTKGHMEDIVMLHCLRNAKQFMTLLDEEFKAEKEKSAELIKKRDALRAFIHKAQDESFYAWRNAKYASMNTTSMLIELATLLPVLPKACSLVSHLFKMAIDQ